jgi:hypothetical protein
MMNSVASLSLQIRQTGAGANGYSFCYKVHLAPVPKKAAARLVVLGAEQVCLIDTGSLARIYLLDSKNILRQHLQKLILHSVRARVL